MDQKPTIKTIARLAGVSHAAVSRALRGYSDISPATRERIIQIASDIGYTPNLSARNLVLQTSGSIGLLVPNPSGTSFAQTADIICGIAAEHGLSVILGSCGMDTDSMSQQLRLMAENRVGTLIALAPPRQARDMLTQVRLDMPIILLGERHMLGDAPAAHLITYSARQGARMVVEHLAQLGHADIACLHDASDEARILAREFTAQAQNHHLRPRVYGLPENAQAFDESYAWTHTQALDGQLPTAMWCTHDALLLGAARALWEHSIPIPQSVSLLGYGCVSIPKISTLEPPWVQMCEQAAQLALTGRHASGHTLLDMQWIRRGSTQRSARSRSPHATPSVRREK